MRAEVNVKMARTGPGIAAGDWMRRCWEPVTLTEEFAEQRCAHRGADVSGRDA